MMYLLQIYILDLADHFKEEEKVQKEDIDVVMSHQGSTDAGEQSLQGNIDNDDEATITTTDTTTTTTTVAIVTSAPIGSSVASGAGITTSASSELPTGKYYFMSC